MERLHPLLVQFPIALALTSVLFDSLAYALRRPSLHVVGYWNLVLGVIGACFASWTGFVSERSLTGGMVPATLMKAHREAALLALVIFTILLLARITFRRLGRRPISVPIYLVAALIGGVLLARTGQTGNRLVFQAAAGVTPPEYPLVAMLPEGGASRQPVWGLGISAGPAYTRARQLSPSAARLRANLYLRTLVPGKPLLREHFGCRMMQLPLLHHDRMVAGVAVDLESGRPIPRNEFRCSRNATMDARQARFRATLALRQMQVGRAAWLGGHGAYWNVPIVLDGKMLDILRIDMRDGSLIPLGVRQAYAR
jgi:uncharacterized membrane protein